MLIGITGKPASGKSVLMVNLACCMADKGYKTAIVPTDMSFQSIQYFFGSTNIPREKSIGRLFQKRDIYCPEKYFIKADGVKNLYICGTSAGEDHMEGCQSRNDSEVFWKECEKLFDYVLTETSEISSNILGISAILRSKVIFDVVDVSIQGLSYKLSSERILEKLRSENCVLKRVAAANKYIKDLKGAECVLGYKFDYKLPYCRDMELCTMSGLPIYFSEAAMGHRAFIKIIRDMFLELEAI